MARGFKLSQNLRDDLGGFDAGEAHVEALKLL